MINFDVIGSDFFGIITMITPTLFYSVRFGMKMTHRFDIEFSKFFLID